MKKHSKIISLILVISLLAGLFCLPAHAVDTPYEDSLFYTQGDYEIHYRIVEHKGEFRGRIMMLHGFMCSTYAWRNMAANLSEAGYDCVMADLPNFGYSTRETENTRVIDREELIAGLMQSIAPAEEWILAGHSMGGGVAANIAEELPVSRLLLFCPAPQSTCPKGFESIVTSAPMKWMMNTFFKIGTKFTPVVRLVIYAATRNLEFSRSYDVTGVTGPFGYDGIGAGMCQMLVNVRETNLAEADKITCPVLLVNASGDIIINDDMRAQFYNAFPEAQKYIVEGGGHQCIEDRADELCPVVLSFIEGE